MCSHHMINVTWSHTSTCGPPQQEQQFRQTAYVRTGMNQTLRPCRTERDLMMGEKAQTEKAVKRYRVQSHLVLSPVDVQQRSDLQSKCSTLRMFQVSISLHFPQRCSSIFVFLIQLCLSSDTSFFSGSSPLLLQSASSSLNICGSSCEMKS